MFSTKPAHSLRKLFAGYHEPTGLSRQQSQKLLDGLKTSFRSQLDREHGQIPQPATAASEPNEPNYTPHQSAANQHLRSILSNPLFSYNKIAVPPVPPPNTLKPSRDPMEVFDHAVARGMMNLRAATGCLVAKQKQLAMTDLNTESTATIDTAQRVVRWLQSSRIDGELHFLENQQFIRNLVPFLVAERMEDVAWEWILRIMNESSAEMTEERRLRCASFVLAQLVHVKSLPQYGNLNASISTILQAEQLFHDSPLLSKLLVLPWRSVSWLSTVEAYSRSTPSEHLFNAHLETASRLSQPFLVEKAHLQLHHPTHPDLTAALEFFGNQKRLRKMVTSSDKSGMSKSKTMKIIPWIAYLGRDTVSHLKQLGRTEDAQCVRKMLEIEMAEFYPGTANAS